MNNPFLAFTTSVLVSTSAFALDFPAFVKSHSSSLSTNLSKHAFCQSSISSTEVDGYNTSKLVPIASVSKTFTSYFATETFGPFYRFKTKLHVTAYDPASGTASLHIEGSDDPYFTYDKVFFLVSELNRNGIKKIDKLTFDENFRAYTKVREGNNPDQDNDAYKFNPISLQDTKAAMQILMTKAQWGQYNLSANRRRTRAMDGNELYSETVAKANARGAAMLPFSQVTMTTNSVDILPKANFDPSADLKVLTLSSLPLYLYLKDMNTYSNNYIADQMARIAGGVDAMMNFYHTKLGYTDADLQMHTGSGLDLDNDVPVSQRKDNLATCATVLKTLKSFSSSLNALSLTDDEVAYLGKNTIGLMDYMPISGSSDGTYTGADDQKNAVIYKTGTLGINAPDPRLNIAGYVRGQTDIEFYGIFFNYNSVSQEADIKSLRREILSALVKEEGGPRPITGLQDSDHGDFLAFDSASKLTTVVSQSQTAGHDQNAIPSQMP